VVTETGKRTADEVEVRKARDAAVGVTADLVKTDRRTAVAEDALNEGDAATGARRGRRAVVAASAVTLTTRVWMRDAWERESGRRRVEKEILKIHLIDAKAGITEETQARAETAEVEVEEGVAAIAALIIQTGH